MTMRYILSLFALIFFIQTSAQTLTLSGKIVYYDLPKNGRLYYSLKGEHFSSGQSIRYTASGD